MHQRKTRGANSEEILVRKWMLGYKYGVGYSYGMGVECCKGGVVTTPVRMWLG